MWNLFYVESLLHFIRIYSGLIEKLNKISKNTKYECRFANNIKIICRFEFNGAKKVIFLYSLKKQMIYNFRICLLRLFWCVCCTTIGPNDQIKYRLYVWNILLACLSLLKVIIKNVAIELLCFAAQLDFSVIESCCFSNKGDCDVVKNFLV